MNGRNIRQNSCSQTCSGTDGWFVDLPVPGERVNVDLTLQYTYSRCDNYTDYAVDGLPLGQDLQRHAVLAGLRWRIRRRRPHARSG